MGRSTKPVRRGRLGGDLVGSVFGRLVVVSDSGLRSGSGAIRWTCQCSCGNVRYVVGAALKRGDYNSCGCWTKDRVRANPPNKTHGQSKTPTYGSWLAMRRRCLDKTFKDYPQYGGRGISVCLRWRDSFENFVEDMGHRRPGTTLERKDREGDYTPANCVWATRETQGNNTSRNHLLKYGGETHTLAEWSRIAGIPYSRLRARINTLAWPVGRALEKE